MRLALALTSAQADRLRKEADRLGIAPAVLARATLEDLCDLPDAGFRAAAERIVPKNQELSLASPDAVSDACRDPRAAPRDAGSPVARRAFAIWVPGTLRWPSRAALETFLKVHGLRLSPPRGHQRLERHATRLVALGTRVVLDYFYPGGRRVFSTKHSPPSW